MRKKIMKETEIKICDFCGRETEYLEKCGVCGKEGCSDTREGHWAYSLEIFRYADSARNANVHICNECGSQSIKGLMDKLVEK